MDKSKLFVNNILKWHKTNAEKFPWRSTREPYKILIAELLLRKTTRTQVSSVYDIFIERYPNPASLANSSVSEIQRIIKRLGMQRIRATTLKRFAEKLVDLHKGKVPKDEESLLELPGVGRYSKNAVLCFAFGKDVPLVDTNISRVVRRVFDFRANRSRAHSDPQLWQFVQQMLPQGRTTDFNFAVLDFADKVCTARNPGCRSCPMNKFCSHGVGVLKVSC